MRTAHQLRVNGFSSAVVLVLVLTAGFCSRAAAERHLLQQAQPLPPLPPEVITYNPLNRTVNATQSIHLPFTQIPRATVVNHAVYPDPLFENPDGWRFKVLANASIVLGSTSGAALTRIDNIADSKLGPAIALSTGNIRSSGPSIFLSRNGATSRPGLQYGVTLASTDGHVTSTAPFTPVGYLANPVLMLVAQDAVSGQGQTVNMLNGKLHGNNVVVGDFRGRSIADRWYLAPSHAIMGTHWDIDGAQTSVFSRHTARASQGTATSGLIHNLHGMGNIPADSLIKKRRLRTTRFLAKSGALARADNRAFADAGAAQAGNLQLVKSDRGDSGTVGLAQARVAEGTAVAGALNLAATESGYVYIGDYWEELSNPGNAVVATNYGRGPAQAGQINIALTPNAGARIGGTVVATAVQGDAGAGAFTLANGYGELLTDQDVVAVTSEYTATTNNVGVSVAQERSNVINTAVSKSDTGSALSLDVATAVVGKQNSAVSSASAATSTGQAAALSASQSVGGVTSESHAAGVSKTATGNALSVGSAFSGAAYIARSVATSGATTTDGSALSAGWSASVAADSEAAAASSVAVGGAGNAATVTQAYGLGVFEGKATAAGSAGSKEGSVSSLSVGVGTGLFLADSNVASTAQTGDGAAQALAGSLALGGMTSRARASSVGLSGTGDSRATAQALGVGGLHGEANARAVSTSFCPDCVSDAVANAFAVGLVADATAAAKADSPLNPGNALANAMAFGLVSRTSNGGSSRVSVGPGQSVVGGFAVSVPRRMSPLPPAPPAEPVDPTWARLVARLTPPAAVDPGLAAALAAAAAGGLPADPAAAAAALAAGGIDPAAVAAALAAGGAQGLPAAGGAAAGRPSGGASGQTGGAAAAGGQATPPAAAGAADLAALAAGAGLSPTAAAAALAALSAQPGAAAQPPAAAAAAAGGQATPPAAAGAAELAALAAGAGLSPAAAAAALAALSAQPGAATQPPAAAAAVGVSAGLPGLPAAGAVPRAPARAPGRTAAATGLAAGLPSAPAAAAGRPAASGRAPAPRTPAAPPIERPGRGRGSPALFDGGSAQQVLAQHMDAPKQPAAAVLRAALCRAGQSPGASSSTSTSTRSSQISASSLQQARGQPSMAYSLPPLPGGSFLGPLLAGLQAKAQSAQELSAMPDFGGDFSSSAAQDLPVFPNNPLMTRQEVQEQQQQQQQQQQQHGDASKQASHAAPAAAKCRKQQHQQQEQSGHGVLASDCST